MRSITGWTCAIVLCGVLPAFAQDEAAQVAARIAELSGQDAAKKVAAADALGELGGAAKAAVPALVKALEDGNIEVRVAAARALGSLGPATKDAVGPLTKTLKDSEPKVRGYAAFALGKIGPASAPAAADVAVLLTDPSVDIRRAAVTALSEIRPGPKVMIPILSKVLKDADRSVVLPALHALAELGEAGVPGLTEALADPKARYWACLALGEIGPAAKSAAPDLAKLLKEADPEVRLQASVALGQIGPAAAPQAASLLPLLADEQPGVQIGAIFALGKIGSKEAVPALEKNLKSDNAFLKMISAWALAKISPDDSAKVTQAIDLILVALKDKDPHTRRGAAQALYELKAPPEKVGPALMESLADADPSVVAHVIDSFVALGPKAAPRAADALKRKEVRGLAVQVLRRLGPDAASAVPALIDALKEEDTAFRREVLFALAAIGPAAKDAVPVLIKAVSDPNEELRPAACYALGKIGPAASLAVPELRKNLRGEDRLLKFASVWAMLHIFPEDATVRPLAVPVLSGMLEKAPNDMIRVEAVTALGNLKGLAKGALPALKNLADDPNPEVRQAAAEAIKKIEP